MKKFYIQQFKVTVLLLFSLFSVPLSAQTTLYQENFESIANGPVNPSTNSDIGAWYSSATAFCDGKTFWGIYDTGSGIINNRGLKPAVATADVACVVNPGNYDTGTTLPNLYAYTTISTSGYTNITLEFDWKCKGEIVNSTVYDYGSVVYRVGTTGAWTQIITGGTAAGKYYNNISTTAPHATLTLPIGVNNQAKIQFGFRWDNDGNSGAAPSFSVDNIVVKGTALTCTPPTTQASIGAYTNNTSGTGLTVNWTRGTGNNVIVVGRLTATTLVNPTSGTTYTANNTFGTTGTTTGAGNFVVYKGAGTAVNVTGLTNNSNYTFTVYEYNTTSTCYKTPGSSSAVITTLPVPSNDACSNATILPCGTIGLAGTTVGTVSETPPINVSSPYGVWYKFTGDGLNTNISTTAAAGFDHELLIFSASSGCNSTYTQIADVDSALGGGTESASFLTVNGTQYFVYIAYWNASGNSTDTGNFTISRSCSIYCVPSSTSNQTYIHSFSTTGGISNISNLNSGYATNGYQDYYSTQTVSSYPSSTINFSLDLVGGTAGVAIWIDLNNNFVFEASERVYTSNSYLPTGINSATFTIPVSAIVGSYRMRVRTDYLAQNPDPCNSSSTRSETEDYKLTVLPSACITPNPPTALNLTLTGATVNGSFTPPATLPTGYVIARSTSNVVPNPANGTNYTTGATVGAYYIVRGTNTPSTATTFTDTPGIGVFYYYVFSFNAGCTGAPFYSVGISNSLNTCQPKSTSSARYISNVQFLGTLNPDTGNPTEYSTNGYGDFKNKTEKAKQIPGGVINLNVSIAGPLGDDYGTIKAWVDWNRDGIFNDDLTERTYSSDDFNILSTNVIFGFIVKTTTLPGNYTIRIRTNRDNTEFGPCGTLPNGETEDYIFIVEEKCSAEVITLTAAQSCGPGPVVLTATGTSDTTSYKWYKTEFGAEIAGANSNVYTTDNLPVGSYTFYASAFNGTCWSNLRKPIKFTVQPIPTIRFDQSEPDICGSVTNLTITSSGDKQQVMLLEETFDSGTQQFFNDPPTNIYPEGMWKLSVAPYIPENPHFLKPAISSGVNGSKFATIMTDLQYTSSINNYFQSVNLNSSGYSDMFFEFDLYFFSDEDDINRNFLKVQYYSNTEGIWKDLDTYITDIGAPSRFMNQKYALPTDCENITDLKVRFYLFSYSDGSIWLGNIAAIDNIKIYGNKDLPAKFKWSGDTGVIYSSGTCTGSPDPLGSPAVCIKLSDDELKSKSKFKITATAELSNGCNASSTIYIDNNTKIWDATSTTDWNTSNWQPADSKIPPIVNKCVIIRQPIVLGTGAAGLAKNITVQTGGSLTINASQSLTVTDAIVNNAGETNFVVASDANLLQTNDAAVNVGKITVKRNSQLKRLDYTYWTSPVTAQNLKHFSPGTLNNRFYTYNEANDLFTMIDPVGNVFGNQGGVYESSAKGYAIRASNSYPTGSPAPLQVFKGEFVGEPNNGVIIFPLKFKTVSPTTPEKIGNGYNLVGNPYSSNINFWELAANNATSIDKLAYFWTNLNPNPAMQGSGYPAAGYFNNYATLNSVGGIPATLGTDTAIKSATPTEIIKVGQGFLVKAKVDRGTLTFKNAIRESDSNSIFFNKGEVDKVQPAKDRYWLHLKTPLGVITTALVGYVANATNNYDPDSDADLLGLGADALFTKLDSHQLGIQGRQAPLILSDVVQLGTNHYAAGTYVLNLGIREGVFANGQSIYLKDNQTGTVTNLSGEDYTFTANQGLTEDRFQIIYQPEIVLGTNGSLKENLIIYRDGNDFIVKSQSKKITGLEVYDTAGRLIYSLKPNSTNVIVPSDRLVNGVYVLKIDQAGLITTKKIIK